MQPPSVTREISAPIAEVWAVLANGWMYSGWVVGASRIRAVDRAFPAAGTAFHQSIGMWPLVIDDATSVIESREPALLVLQVRSRPVGQGRVWLRLAPVSETITSVEMAEEATHGPAKYLPRRVQEPLITRRNRECLERLARLAEGGAATE